MQPHQQELFCGNINITPSAAGQYSSSQPSDHPTARTPEKRKDSYAEIARGKRGHPPQSNGGNGDDDLRKPPSASTSPHSKIQKREPNEISHTQLPPCQDQGEKEVINRSSDLRSSSHHATPFRGGRGRGRGKSGEREGDPKRLAARQKQIDFGKNTIGYQRYCAEVPRSKRTSAHPWTPDRQQICSKRSWDGQVRKWRRALHEYDPPGTAPPGDGSDMEANDNNNDELQPDEGLLADDPVAAPAASSSASSASAPQISTEGSNQPSGIRKLLWSDVVEEDEVFLHEMQPPPST